MFHGFRDNLRMAWSNLFTHKFRSVLTLLGLIIGVAAVISIVSLGEGLKLYFSGEIGALGANSLMIMPKSLMGAGDLNLEGRTDNFKMADVQALRRNTTLFTDFKPGMRTTKLLKRGDKTYLGIVDGSEPGWAEMAGTSIAEGRDLTEGEVRSRSRVAIIGHSVREHLFAVFESPLGQTFRVGDENFTVIGVLEEKGGGGGGGPTEDDFVVVPITTMQDRIIGSDEVAYILAKVKDTSKLSEAKDEVRHILRQRRKLSTPTEEDFELMTSDDFLEFGTRIVNVMTTIFGTIAAFSLLIGGIGVMSIMLVTVTERTREIGLRMAVGASPSVVLGQFLSEAILLTIIGGSIGLASGWGLAIALSALIARLIHTEWTPAVPVIIMVITLLCSALFGVVFGIIPAYLASRKDPVESLRYE
jgi:putative ABC transport system permease protein